MRVVSGELRGKKLIAPIGVAVRPTSDMVKQAIFNSIQFEIEGAVVLDLFAGSGAMGIEAISRGAKKVYFCDNNREAVAAIGKNLSGVSPQKYEVFFGDYSTCIKKNAKESFDIVFIDPPYGKNLDTSALDVLAQTDNLSPDCIIAVELSSKNDLHILPEKFIIKSKRRYGNTSVVFLHRNEESV